MKSLVEFISCNENSLSLDKYITESRREFFMLAKTILKGDPKTKAQNIYDDIVKAVKVNSKHLIDAEDVDSLENGMLIGYLKGGENFSKFATIAIMDDEDNEWYILTVHLGKRSNDIELHKEKADVKLYTSYFGKAWQIYYTEHVDDDLLEAIIKTENTIGKLN